MVKQQENQGQKWLDDDDDDVDLFPTNKTLSG